MRFISRWLTVFGAALSVALGAAANAASNPMDALRPLAGNWACTLVLPNGQIGRLHESSKFVSPATFVSVLHMNLADQQLPTPDIKETVSWNDGLQRFVHVSGADISYARMTGPGRFDGIDVTGRDGRRAREVTTMRSDHRFTVDVYHPIASKIIYSRMLCIKNP